MTGTIEARSGTTLSPGTGAATRIAKTGGGTGYDASAVGTTAYAGDFTLQASALSPSGADFFVGMNADPVTDDGYHSIDYSLQLYSDGRAWLHENGALLLNAPVNGKVWIWREGTVLKYGTGPDLATAAGSGLMRTVQNAAGTLYFDSSFKNTTSEAEVLVQSPASTGGGSSGGGLTGPATFAYDSENRLVSASGAVNATLAYDPLGRLYAITSGGVTRRLQYDGDGLVEERGGAATLLRRYAHGSGPDEPLVQYEGSGCPTAASSTLTSGAASSRRLAHAKKGRPGPPLCIGRRKRKAYFFSGPTPGPL